MQRILLALLIALSTLPCARAMDLSPLESVTIQEGGRKKPYIVFAQESLLGLCGRTKIVLDGKKWSAVDLVTALWLSPAGWDQKPLLLVNNKPLKDAIGLDPARKHLSYAELAANQKLIALLTEAGTLRAQPGNQRLTGLPQAAAEVGLRMAEFENLTNGSAFRFVANPAAADAKWFNAPEPTLAGLREAYRTDNKPAFDKALTALTQSWAATEPQFQPEAWKISLEVLYQKFHPFRWAWIFYAAAGVILLLAARTRLGYALAWLFAGFGFLFQLAGFAARVAIAARAPVTNMYESVVWVAFGTVLFALIFEAIYRSRYFFLGAVPVAVVSLLLADTQPLALNPSITPLVPVLRDNFWLSTHVLTITLSYAAFLLALGVGHIILGMVIGARKPSPALYNYLYRVVQVGVLLLATGTILGAVWANYSWGRFWDWDPKETWALITLLGYLFVLHGRIAGKWGGFGLAVGAVLCFLGVLMAWYGVNFVLGVGLHSYGFGTGGFGWAILFVAVELVFVACAIVAHRRNRLAARTAGTQANSPQPREGTVPAA